MDQNQLLEIIKQQSEALNWQSHALSLQTEALLASPEPHIIRRQPESTSAFKITEQAVKAVLSVQEIEAIILEIIARVSPYAIDDLSKEQYLVQELSFDSLMIMQLQSELQSACAQRFTGVRIEEMFTRVQEDVRIADIINYIVENTNASSDNHFAGEVIASSYQVKLFPEYVQLKARIKEVGGGNPYFRIRNGINKNMIEMTDEMFVNYASYNYLGFAEHKCVQKAVVDAVLQYGTSVSASRMLSGEIPLHLELEKAIASFIGADDALVYTSGHATNVSTIASIVGPPDLILHDELSHNSIVQGCLLSGAVRQPFSHNDWQEVKDHLIKLRPKHRRVLIIVEGAYSMDGDIPDLRRFVELKKQHQAMLMIDEAHSIGTIGKTGRGVCEYTEVDPQEVDFLMGTLSKSLASCGGYIAAGKEAIELLKYTSDSFIFSAGITPANAAAALEAVRLLDKDSSYVKRLQDQSNLFLKQCFDKRLNTGLSKDTPIIPIQIGNSEQALALGSYLYEKKINVCPIVYPAVPDDAACLRFFITADHTDEQIFETVQCIAEGMKVLAVGKEYGMCMSC